MGCRIYLHSLGCRLNESEVETMARRFASAGHAIVTDPAEADVCVVNTCAVTAEAARKSRHCVRALARANPAARLAVTGCYATLAPERCAALPGAAWVVPNAEKEGLVAAVLPAQPRPAEAEAGPPVRLRTRAFVKVQDGCDNHCTYCVVRLLRGPARSRPLADVVRQVQALVEAGYQEAVLTGVNLGSYGRDLGLPDGLYTLVAALLARTALPRLRLSSLEPWDLNESAFGLWESPRMCRQLHLPLQSGCDEVLRRMARRGTPGDFAKLVAAARARIPGLALTTDLIAGFPGETEAMFQQSYRFVQDLAFARLHVFPYSPRPGTAAARMPDQVAPQARAERARALRQLGAQQARAFRQRFVGHTLPVLWEKSGAEGLWRGHTDNYLSVRTVCEADLFNRITPTRLVEALGQELEGEIEKGGRDRDGS